MIPDLEKAWAAGFFEGEGTVAIMKPRKRNWGSLMASSVNTEKHLIEFFCARWGGCLREMKMSGKRKRAWRWTLSSRQAASFLKDIEPFVFGQRMKDRIFLALAFQSNKWSMSRHVSAEDREDYWRSNIWYWRQFSFLNQRGTTCSDAPIFRK